MHGVDALHAKLYVIKLLSLQIHAKVLKGKALRGVCAQRFHTVLYTDDAIFTFGLNAGQLGMSVLFFLDEVCV